MWGQATGMTWGSREWVLLVVALDRFAASLVARCEHELTRADPVRAAQLRHQRDQALRLEIATAGAAARAAREAETATGTGARA